MRILLVAPASGKWRRLGRRRMFNGKTFRFSMLSLLTVAELTPREDEVRLIDEQVDRVPEEEPFDLVGITVMTATAPRAYELSQRFRTRGTRVVLGGFHPTLNPEEALRHADAVVLGCAYGAWEALLEDARAGKLKRVYHGDPNRGIPASLPRHLLARPHYLTINATFATLGCRNACRFCAINRFHNGKFYARPVIEVVNEVATFDSCFLILVDDNLTQDRQYAIELLRALAPLGKKWVTQVSVQVAEDEEVLELLYKAGCIGLFVGLETFDPDALAGQEKGFNNPDFYKEAVSAMHRHGMFVEAGIMFGFDTDGCSVFHTTLEMLDHIGIDGIQVSILTPIPGTPLFEQLRPRIVDTNWEHYDYRHAVFAPARMSREALQAGAH